MSVQEQVIEILADVTASDDGEIKPEHKLIADLSMNDIDVAELCNQLDEEFDIDVPERTADAWLNDDITVQGLVEYVTANK